MNNVNEGMAAVTVVRVTRQRTNVVTASYVNYRVVRLRRSHEIRYERAQRHRQEQ